MKVVKVQAQFPEKLMPLFAPAPVKIIYGGRGKGASWGIARALLILGAKRKLFVVCAREVQKSIKDSVHKLLSDQINNLGYHAHGNVPAFYEVLDTEIRGRNGTTFVFVGLNNVNSLKSMEGIDVLWVTEAVHVPRSKWNILFPTVRRDAPFGPFKQGSEIWMDLNPELASDDTYKSFVIERGADYADPDTVVNIEMNYQDNPFFPDFLRKQMEAMRKNNYDDYLHVWMGKTRKVIEGAIFANEIRTAIVEGRIGPHVLYDPKKPVVLSFDLGDSDMTAMWAWQQAGNEHRCVYYHEDNGQDITHFLEIAQEKRYMVKRVLLPHDAEQEHQSARKLVHNTIKKQAQAFYPTPGVVKVIPNTKIPIQINAARALLPRVLMNESECDRGLLCLQHYQYGVDQETRERTKAPLHNWASHGASGFMQYCVFLREGVNQERQRDIDDVSNDRYASLVQETGHSQGWMR